MQKSKLVLGFLFFFALGWLSFESSVLAQDTTRQAPMLPARVISADSNGPAKSASPSQELVTTEENIGKISSKDWLTSGIALFAALVAFVTLVLSVYLARKRKAAELRAEHEFKKRVELEERQRKIDEYLALQTAGRLSAQQHAQQEKAQKTKTAEERYRHILENEVCQIHLTAPGAEGIHVSLLDSFVSLNISEHYRGTEFPLLGDHGRAHGEHEDLSPEEVVQRAFLEYGRKLLLIIGDPGSGKTTLLKYYAMCCLQTTGHDKLGFKQPVFPMFLPLREVDPDQSIAVNLSNWARKHDPVLSQDEFQSWLDERETLILLDGLDEVSKLEDRKKVCAWIDTKCAGHKRSRFVLTSRGTGMRGTDNLVLNTRHMHAEVRDFSHEQKQEFLRKWFRAAHLESNRPRRNESEADWRARQLREAEQNANEVIAYLDQKENRSLRELAGIPMLLQLLALIWKQYKTKPESRTKLYDVALDYLLEYRDDQRGLAPLLKADKVRRVLQPAALWMQEELGTEEVLKEKLHSYIRPILEPIHNTLTAEALCENLIERAGVIANYGNNEYIFRHKSFREYFAGLQLVSDYDEKGRLGVLAKSFGNDTWAEPLRYFISRADRKAFNAFFTVLFDHAVSRDLSQPQQDLLQTLVREAAEKPLEALLDCLHDQTKNENQQRYALDCLKAVGGERVREALTAILQRKAGKAKVLAYAAEIAAQLSDPAVREASAPAKRDLFDELPVSFRNPIEYNAEYILMRGGTITSSVTERIEKIPDIYFAKYPVTNRQYRRFVRYLRGEESELAKLISLLVFAERLLVLASHDKAYLDYLNPKLKAWPDKLKSEQDEDRKFNNEEQPVVGVSWYGARAYCFWLTAMQMVNGSEPGESVIYRLPHEMEWERVAAGRQKNAPLGKVFEARKYPWPNEKGEPNEKLANYANSVGQTTPVGRYPEGATPEGLMDMAGNVWEWQENWSDATRMGRALRGGSWDGLAGSLRCSIRSKNGPRGRSDDVGFRVARAQSSFDTLKL